MKIDGANLLDGILGNGQHEEISYGAVSTGTDTRIQQTETLSKGEQVSEVIYQKPGQEKKSGTTQEVMQQADNMDTAQMKEKMVVASHTTTTTDCKKAEEDGFSLDQTEIDTIVTVTDKIKMELAKAGADVSYFTDGCSTQQLEEITGSAALAEELAAKFRQADVPLTEENTDDLKKAVQQAEELRPLNDGALKYMLDNGLEPSIANLYKAQYSGSAMYVGRPDGELDVSGMEEQILRIITQAGLTADEQAMADSRWLIQNQIPLTAENLKELEQLRSLELPKKMEEVLDAAVTALSEGNRPEDAVLADGYSLADKAQHVMDVLNQTTEEDLAYVVGQGQTVSIQNLEQAHEQTGSLNQQEKEKISQLIQSTADTDQIPQTGEEMALSGTGHDGSGSATADTTDPVSAASNATVSDLTEGAVQEAAAGGVVEDTDNNAVQSGISGNTDGSAGAGGVSGISSSQDSDELMQNGSGNMSGNQNSGYSSMQLTFIVARRQLEEVRLIMTQGAAYNMFKNGISVNTGSIRDLISQLRELENRFYQELLTEGGVEATEASISVFAETSEKIEQLKYMPAYAIATWSIETVTLEEMHQSGSQMQQNFQQANERYETMQTEVRKDLGDSIQKAFGNVDDILESLDMETSAANERAVRILGYNSITITRESITYIKAADQQVQTAFHNLTPAVVRELIAKGVNPLDMDIVSLNRQAQQIKAELDISATEEKYSEYLFKLEQNNSITQEERSSYIGIFRLMNQVAQSDGAAVGALAYQGAEITMRNLLSAVRTGKHGNMDISVDNSFGELQSGGYEDSIIDQIDAGYQNQCMNQVMDEISPERLRMAAREGQWEDMTPEQFLEQLRQTPEDTAAEEAWYQQKLEDLAQCAQTSEEVYQVMEQYGLPETVLNVLAVSELMHNRNGAYRRFFGMGNGRRPDSDISDKEFITENDDGSVDTDFDAIRQELLERFSDDVKKPRELAKAMAELAECAEKCMSTMILEQDVSSLDIRELKLMNAQISVSAKMSSEECFSMPVVVDGEVTNVTLKIVRGREQKGLINITLETARFGKIAAELKAKQEGISGYVATDSVRTRDYLQSIKEEIAQALQPDGKADLNFVTSNQLDLNHFASRGSSEEPETEELRELQTKTLYGMAEGFIKILRRMDAA